MKMAFRYPVCAEFHQNAEMSAGLLHHARVIAFERRVLDEARNGATPLLERVKFLGVLGGNLDELMMVHGRTWASRIGAKRVARKTHALLRKAYRVLKRELLPALASAGLHVVDYASLTRDEQTSVDRQFAGTVLPHITPLRDLTMLPGLGFNLAVVVDDEPLHLVESIERARELGKRARELARLVEAGDLNDELHCRRLPRLASPQYPKAGVVIRPQWLWCNVDAVRGGRPFDA